MKQVLDFQRFGGFLLACLVIC